MKLDYTLMTARAPGEGMEAVTARLFAFKRVVRRLLRTKVAADLFALLGLNTSTAVVVAAGGKKWRLLAVEDGVFEEVQQYLRTVRAMRDEGDPAKS